MKDEYGYSVANFILAVLRLSPIITEWKITPNSRIRKAAIY